MGVRKRGGSVGSRPSMGNKKNALLYGGPFSPCWMPFLSLWGRGVVGLPPPLTKFLHVPMLVAHGVKLGIDEDVIMLDLTIHIYT